MAKLIAGVRSGANGFYHTREITLRKALFASTALVGIVMANPAQAADHQVGSSADLSSAITASNLTSGDTITLTADVTLSDLMPVIRSGVSVIGNGHTISGANTYRIFFVDAGAAAVSFNDVVLANGLAQGGNGAAGGGGGMGAGGAVFVNSGAVTANNVSFSGDNAKGGAAIANSGPRSGGGGGGLGGSGGGSSFGGGGGGGYSGGGGGGGGTTQNSIDTGNAAGGAGQGGAGGNGTSSAGSGTAGANGGGAGGTGTGSVTFSFGGGGGGGAANGGAGGNSSGGGGGGAGLTGLGGTGGNSGGSPTSGGIGGGGGGSASGSTTGGATGGDFGGGGGAGASFSVTGGQGGYGGGGGGSAYTNGGIGGFGGGGGNGVAGGAGGGAGTAAGGGGAGLGGAVFVRSGTGASFAITTTNSTSNVVGGTAIGGTSTNGKGGAGAGAGLLLASGTTTGISVSAGNTTTINGIADDSATSLTGANGTTAGTGTGAAVSVSGGGTLVLTGSNTYAGQTTVNGSTLRVGNGTTNGTLSSAVVMSGGSNLTFNDTTAQTYASPISGAGSVSTIGAGAVTFGGAGSWTGVTTIGTGATLIGTTATIAGSNIANGGSLVYDQGTDGNAGRVISGVGSLTKQGTGSVTLVNGTNYTGGTNVQGGRLVVVNQSAPSGTTAISTGATFEDNVNSGTLYLDGTTFTGAGTFVKSGNGTLASRGLFAMAAGSLIDVQAGRLVGSSDNQGRFTGNLASLNVASGATFSTSEATVQIDKLTGAGLVEIGSPGSLTIGVAGGSGSFAGVIANQGPTAGTLTKIGAGTQTLTGVSTFTGTTTISAGTLALAGAGSIANSTIINNASFDISAHTGNISMTTLTGAGATALGANTLTLTNANGTYSGVLSGTGGLTKQGTALYVLTGANTFTGTTSVTQGTLALGNGGATGTLAGDVAVSGGAVLQINRSGTPTVANAFSGAGSVELVQSASLTGVVSTSGGVRIGSGQVGTLSNVQSTGNAVTLNVGSILVTNTGGVVASTGATGVTTQSSAGAIINSGTIVGLTGGINAATTIGTTTITNNGTIGVGTYSGGAYTFGGTGYGIAVTGSSSINNLGTIRGSGAAIFNDGALILVNTGAIRGGQGSAATQDAVYAVSANIVNGGSITTTDRLGTLAVPTYAAINLNAGSSTVTNGAAGILTGGSDAFYGNAVQSAGITTFNNYGSATGQGTASGFRQLSNAASTINLFAGSTTGNIVTNAGNDTVSIFNGRGTTGLSEISGSGVVLQNAGTQAAASFGTIALGTGSNVVQLRGTGNGTAANGAAATIALNTLSGASFITKMDAGTWTLTGAASGATAAANINAGVGGAPGSGGLLIFNGSGLTGAINVNGATIRAMSTNAFGTGTIFTFDPTVQFGATGTYTNAITVQSVDPVADPTILQTFGTNITATLSGAITQAGGAAQPIVFSSVDATGTANTGTFVLSNTTNNWAGVTTVSAGTTLRGTYQSISGGSITNSGILNYNQNTDGTATQAITGSGAFIKNGSGNLTLSGANGWTGVTTVSGGTLTGTSASIAGSSIVNNSALVYNQTGSGTVTQAISGNATVTVTGLAAGNTLIFNSALSNLGGISAVGSSVQINAGSAGGILESGSGARTLTIAGGTANNATNNFGGSGLYINGGTGPTTVNVASGATLSTTSGNGNRDGITALSTTIVTNRGTISSGFNAAVALAGGGSIDNFGTLTGGNGGNGYGLAVSNILAANVTLETSSIVSGGAGGVTFQTTGTGVDSTQFSNAGQISSARYGIDIGGPGSPFITNTATGTISGGLAGILRESGASDAVTINNSGAIVGTGGIAIDNQSGASTFTLTNLAGGNIVGSTNGIRSTSATVITNSGVIASGTLAGGTSGALTVSGQSGITLSGGGSVSNLAGGVIRGATYGIDASGGATTISSNGEITGNNGTAIRTGTLADSVSLGANSVTNGIVSLGGGADTLTLSAGATGTGQLDGGVGTDAFILDGTGAGSIDISRVVNFESRTKNGTSGFTLTGADVSTVGWTINGGSLLANTGSINAGAAVTVNANGTLGTLGNLTIASLSGAGNVALGANTLTLGGDNSSTSFSGIASGTGGLVKTGTGTFTISGANAYTGATDITAGTLRFGASDVLSDATDLTIRNGATLDLNGFSDTVGTFSLFGTLTGGGLITANATNLYGGTLGMALSSPTVNQVSGTTLVTGTIEATNLNITGGTLQLGADDRIGDGGALTVNAAGTLDLQTFDDTVASVVSAGTVNGSGTLTAATYELQGGTVNANLGTGSLTQTSGISTLNGASAASSVGVTGGTLLLGAAERLDDGATLTIDANGTLDLAGFQETVASASIGGTLDGTGTLNAATYALTGGTMNANLGAGTLTQVSGTSTLNGTSAATIVDVTGGTLLLGAAERLDDGAALTIDTNGTLDLAGFQETVASASIGGTLNGTGTLNAATYTLTGGTVNANLGAGTLTQVSGTSTLNGTSAATIVDVTGGTLLLGAAERLDDGAALTIDTSGTLDLAGFHETVASANIGGTLNGTGTLNAATYALTGGTVNANLRAGTLTQVSGTSTLNGTSAAAIVNVTRGTLLLGAAERLDDGAALTIDTNSTLDLAGFQETVGSASIGGTLNGTGTLNAATYALTGGTVNANLGAGTLTQVTGTSTLNGTSAAAVVNVAGGTLVLGASERLDDAATLSVDAGGILDLAGFQETVGTAAIGGTLNGTGTLTAATYALNGATVNANFGTGTLTQISGASLLNGRSLASQVNITGGTLLLGASERLDDGAALVIDTNGILDLAGFQETVASTNIGGVLNGTGTLNAATYALIGGTVNANLGTGTLTQISGTSTLNGTSAASQVNVTGGTLLLGASDRLADSAALSIDTNGVLDLAGFQETVASTSIGGTLNGTGTLNAATYALSGGTVNANLGAGTLNQTSGTSTLNGTSSAALVNIVGGTLLLGASDRLSSAAALTVTAPGTFDLAGYNQTVAQLSGSGAIALGSGRLSVVQNTTTDFSGSISGSGGLSKSGTGALSLSGTSTYTGATLVTGGLLSVNGVIASPVTVSGSGRLGGNGRVGGVTIASGATLAPGNSIGTLNINGNLTVASGAFYAVETSPTAADRVNVSGTATLQGGTVQVLASGTAYAPLTRYTILTAAGGVTGAFAGLTSNYTFLTPELEYAPTAVALVLRRNNVAFSSVAQTPNQLAVAVALQGVGVSGLSDAILPLDAPGARQAFDALSGEIYASVPSALIAEGSKVRDALLLNGRRTGEGFGIWGDLVDSTGQFDANTNIGTAKLDTLNKGVLAGIDYGQGGFRGSVVGGYSEGTYSMGTRGSSARVESYHAGGQVGYTAGRFHAEVGGAYSWHDIYTKRTVAFTNFAESVKSSQNAHTVQGFGEVGYALFDGPTFRFEPFAGYTHIRASVDGTQETPGLSALTVGRVSRDVDYTTAGFHLTAKVPVGGAGTLFQPRLSVAWQHGWGDLAGTATSALAGTAPFTITGAVLAGDAVKIDSGFDLSFGAVRVGASYVATAGEHQQDHGAKVTIGVQF